MEKSHYKLLKNISNFNKKDYPNWDGTHQDYLFLDKNKILMKKIINLFNKKIKEIFL